MKFVGCVITIYMNFYEGCYSKIYEICDVFVQSINLRHFPPKFYLTDKAHKSIIINLTGFLLKGQALTKET